MIFVICGEDVSSARQYYVQKIEEFKSKNNRVTEIVLSDIIEVAKQDSSPVDLFGTPSIYTISSLSSGYKGRKMTPLKSAIVELAKNTSTILLDWEGSKGAYELASFKKIVHEWHEAKLSHNIFQLLEACHPGNKKVFIQMLRTIGETQEDMFIYTLLWKHVRSLILSQGGSFNSRVAPWQRAKLTTQASLWKQDKLVAFYEGLAKIDLGLKTSSSVFSVNESIELLCCYFM